MNDNQLKQWNGAKIGGIKGGATNAKSGHMKEIQKKNEIYSIEFATKNLIIALYSLK
jgi:hypothetical protein